MRKVLPRTPGFLCRLLLACLISTGAADSHAETDESAIRAFKSRIAEIKQRQELLRQAELPPPAQPMPPPPAPETEPTADAPLPHIWQPQPDRSIYLAELRMKMQELEARVAGTERRLAAANRQTDTAAALSVFGFLLAGLATIFAWRAGSRLRRAPGEASMQDDGEGSADRIDELETNSRR